MSRWGACGPVNILVPYQIQRIWESTYIRGRWTIAHMSRRARTVGVIGDEPQTVGFRLPFFGGAAQTKLETDKATSELNAQEQTLESLVSKYNAAKANLHKAIQRFAKGQSYKRSSSLALSDTPLTALTKAWKAYAAAVDAVKGVDPPTATNVLCTNAHDADKTYQAKDPAKHTKLLKRKQALCLNEVQEVNDASAELVAVQNGLEADRAALKTSLEKAFEEHKKQLETIAAEFQF